MNVLLAEANVPTRAERDGRRNPEFPQHGRPLVIGANDVVNPDARNAPVARSTACRS